MESCQKPINKQQSTQCLLNILATNHFLSPLLVCHLNLQNAWRTNDIDPLPVYGSQKNMHAIIENVKTQIQKNYKVNWVNKMHAYFIYINVYTLNDKQNIGRRNK